MNAAEKERHEEARFLSQKTTPRSEQRRSAWGSLEMSLQTIQGRCTTGRKCVKRSLHNGRCWPADD